MAQRCWDSRRVVARSAVMLLLLSALATVLAACGSSQPQSSSGQPSAQAVVAAFSGSTENGERSDGTAAGQARTSNGGGVTIEASWENAERAAGPLTFSVVMDTHSINLDGYDLGELAVLRNDRGQEVRPELWDAPPGGHHRSGTLLFPDRDPTGNPILAPNVKEVELLIRDVAGVTERILRWEVS